MTADIALADIFDCLALQLLEMDADKDNEPVKLLYAFRVFTPVGRSMSFISFAYKLKVHVEKIKSN